MCNAMLRPVSSRRIIVVGGGAAGFFAAITCAESMPGTELIILERSSQFLSKVRISGGGRCNVTHACDDPLELSTHYPRGGKSLIGPFRRFGPSAVVAWFEQRGVPLKTEDDGRIFPRSDRSQSVVQCLLNAALARGIRLECNRGVIGAKTLPGGGFRLSLADGTGLVCDRLLLAMGGCRTPASGELAHSLGHALEPPVPSLFTFQVSLPRLNEFAGIVVDDVELSVPQTQLRARGPMLLTHIGLSGPAILKLSAWGARILHDRDYRFNLQVNWFPQLSFETLADCLRTWQHAHPSRLVSALPPKPIPTRLWRYLLECAGIAEEIRWAECSRAVLHRLGQQLMRTLLPVTGKSLNKEEFVTCGGVRIAEVDFKTMQSRITPGLHLAGEVLDIDGLTGGFNFQAAWTSGWIAGRALAR